MGASSPYVARGNQRDCVVRTQTFNIDNGSGTTLDEAVLNLPYAIDLVAVRAIYQEATDTSGAASANFKLGITAGGATIVGSTAYEVSKAVGATTVATILINRIAANTTLFVRHTGRAATEAGQALIEIVYRPVP